MKEREEIRNTERIDRGTGRRSNWSTTAVFTLLSNSYSLKLLRLQKRKKGKKAKEDERTIAKKIDKKDRMKELTLASGVNVKTRCDVSFYYLIKQPLSTLTSKIPFRSCPVSSCMYNFFLFLPRTVEEAAAKRETGVWKLLGNYSCDADSMEQFDEEKMRLRNLSSLLFLPWRTPPYDSSPYNFYK